LADWHVRAGKRSGPFQSDRARKQRGPTAFEMGANPWPSPPGPTEKEQTMEVLPSCPLGYFSAVWTGGQLPARFALLRTRLHRRSTKPSSRRPAQFHGNGARTTFFDFRIRQTGVCASIIAWKAANWARSGTSFRGKTSPSDRWVFERTGLEQRPKENHISPVQTGRTNRPGA